MQKFLKSKKAKMASAFLSVVMLLGLLPVAAFAAPPPTPEVVPAATYEDFTAPEDLQRQAIAPDLLTMWDGTPVTTAEQWAERRQEVRALLEYYFYGPVPIYNGDYYDHTISGSSNNAITVGLRGGASPDTTRNLTAVTITYPSGEAPEGGWPLFLDAPNAAFWRSMGYATASIPTSRTAFNALYPQDSSDWSKTTGAYGVAAYNVEMLIKGLEAEAEGDNRLNINPAKVAVAGSSTNGKRAAAIGAMADSVWLSVPGAGGTGGVNLYRQNSASTTWNTFSGVSTLAGSPSSLGSIGNNTTGEWGPIGLAEAWGGHAGWAGNFGGNYSKIPGMDADFAPVDAHFVAAMMARENSFYFPTTGLSNEGTNGVPGLQLTIDLALPVYELLGLADHLGARITTTAHGTDLEASVLVMATIDHVEGRHGEDCDGSCDFQTYYDSGAVGASVQSYINSLDFNISHMHITPFKSEENAATFERILPCCNGDCEECTCPEWCKFTADGQCCDPGAPEIDPNVEVNTISLDFTGEDVDGNLSMGRPRQGIGWPGAANRGTVNANGQLQQRFTNHGGGILFTLPLGDAKLGNYGKLTFDLLVSESSGAEADSDIGVLFTSDASQFPASGNWWDAASLKGIKIMQPYAGVGVTQSYEIDLTGPFMDEDGNVTGLTNLAKWATGDVYLAIGRNTHTQTLVFDNIVLHPLDCDCETCVRPSYELIVETDKTIVNSGEYFNVDVSISEPASTNTMIVSYDYDASRFAYRGFTPGEGVSVLNTVRDDENGSITFTLAKIGAYEWDHIGTMLFSGLEDVELPMAPALFDVNVQYVFKADSSQKYEFYLSGSGKLLTGRPWIGDPTLIDLSNAIDFFGVTAADSNWDSAMYYDFNGNGEIDISDISYIAVRIR